MRRVCAQARLRECERDKDAAEARARELECRVDALQRELAAVRERPPAHPASGHRAATNGGAEAGAAVHAAVAVAGSDGGGAAAAAAAAPATLQLRLHAQEERVRQLERRVADGRRVLLVSTEPPLRLKRLGGRGGQRCGIRFLAVRCAAGGWKGGAVGGVRVNRGRAGRSSLTAGGTPGGSEACSRRSWLPSTAPSRRDPRRSGPVRHGTARSAAGPSSSSEHVECPLVRPPLACSPAPIPLTRFYVWRCGRM